MNLCALCACLVSVEAREGIGSPGVGCMEDGNYHIGVEIKSVSYARAIMLLTLIHLSSPTPL